jgi:hypothetical protein
LGNNEDRVVVADAVMSCNILEWAGGGDAEYFFGGSTKHLEGSGRQLLVLEQVGGRLLSTPLEIP